MSSVKTIESHGSDSVLLNGGTSFVTLPSHDCNEIAIFQETGLSIDILPWNGIDFVTASSPSGITIPVAANSQEFAIRRTDLSATPVKVRFLYRKFPQN